VQIGSLPGRDLGFPLDVMRVDSGPKLKEFDLLLDLEAHTSLIL
jgi:hypothetical protein